jgi:hypothetical protein
MVRPMAELAQYAVQSGRLEVIDFLLDNGAGVNWTAGGKQTCVLVGT